MLYLYYLFFFLLSSSILSLSPSKIYSQNILTKWIGHPSPIIQSPKYSKQAEKEIPKFIKAHKNDNEPRFIYELALLYIQVNKYDEAQVLLDETIKIDPNFVDARIQLGYLNLWNNNYQESYKQFLFVYENFGCMDNIQTGLKSIGQYFVKNEINYSISLNIFENLNKCKVNDPDILLYLGILYFRGHQKEKAEHYLKKSLEIDPKNIDADITLAYLYISEGRLQEAQKLFEKHPNHCEAIVGLARLKQSQSKTRKSNPHYIEALDKCPADHQLLKEAAKAAQSSRNFKEAKEYYSLYIPQNPLDFRVWEESQITRSYTNSGFLLDVTYTNAKENDPILGVPVVKDFYTYASFDSILPVNDDLRFDLKGFFYNQKEVNIFSYGLNYNVDLSGGQTSVEYLFMDQCRFQAFARAFCAWQQNDPLFAYFPFEFTWNFEPGAYFEYNSPFCIFYLDAHIESFITKNFQENSSILIPLGSEEIFFLFRPNVYLNPQIETSLILKQLWDNNFEPVATIQARCNLPFLEKYLTFQYRFEYSSFKFLTPNYFTYDLQYWQFAELTFHYYLLKNLYFKAIYEFNLQLTKNLIQPIGNFLNITQKQSLTGNKITCNLTYRYLDHIRFAIEGHYYRNTLIYRDWNLKGSLLLQF
jgi:tetratricopeptide (TPR) repeat protein